MKPQLAWRATNRSGVGHAFPTKPLRAPALCGIANADERYDWPKRFRCDLCSKLATA